MASNNNKLHQFKKEENMLDEVYHRSPLGCSKKTNCIMYRSLINKKIRKGVPKREDYFNSIAPSLYKYLTLDDLMDVDLIWVSFGYIERWVCKECYKNVLKPLKDNPLAGVDL